MVVLALVEVGVGLRLLRVSLDGDHLLSVGGDRLLLQLHISGWNLHFRGGVGVVSDVHDLVTPET